MWTTINHLPPLLRRALRGAECQLVVNTTCSDSRPIIPPTVLRPSRPLVLAEVEGFTLTNLLGNLNVSVNYNHFDSLHGIRPIALK